MSLTIRCDGFDFSPFNPTQFRLSFSKIPHIPFFCQTVNMPDITMGTAVAASRWHDINMPGEKLTFGELSAEVLLDTDMVSYAEMYNWMKNISVINTSSDYTSTCSVHTGSKIFQFNDVYPIVLGSLRLSKTTTDSPALVFSTVFRFTTFDIK